MIIRKNSTKKIAEVAANLVSVDAHSLDSGFNAERVELNSLISRAGSALNWIRSELADGATLTQEPANTFKLRIHSNLWYTLHTA